MSANDKQIEQYREAVENKREEMGAKPNPSWITNQLLQLDPHDTAKLNLNLLNDEAKCVDAVRLLMLQVQAHDAANEALSTNLKLMIGGYSSEDWITDIKSRLSIIQWNAEKVKLDKMDKKLQALLSEDAKTANAIADIASELDL